MVPSGTTDSLFHPILVWRLNDSFLKWIRCGTSCYEGFTQNPISDEDVVQGCLSLGHTFLHQRPLCFLFYCGVNKSKQTFYFPSKHEVNIMYDMFIAWKGIALLLPGFSLNCDKCVKGPLCVCGHNQILDPLYIRAEVSWGKDARKYMKFAWHRKSFNVTSPVGATNPQTIVSLKLGHPYWRFGEVLIRSRKNGDMIFNVKQCLTILTNFSRIMHITYESPLCMR